MMSFLRLSLYLISLCLLSSQVSFAAQNPPREPPYTDLESTDEPSDNSDTSDPQNATDTEETAELKTAPTSTVKSASDAKQNLGASAPTPEMERAASDKKVQEIHHPDAARKGLLRIDDEGSYYYRTMPTPQKNAGIVLAGTMSAPKLDGSDDGYRRAYGNSTTIILAIWEYQFLKLAVGKLGLRVGSGLLIAQGSGRFVNNYAENFGKTPKERFDLFGFPNHADIVYRMHFWDKQPLIPYGFAGGDYFTFIEMRNDNRPTRYAGAAAGHVGAGVSFSFNWLDRLNMSRLDQEYGINNIMLTAEGRQMVGVKPGFALNSQVITFGITAEY